MVIKPKISVVIPVYNTAEYKAIIEPLPMGWEADENFASGIIKTVEWYLK